MRVEIVSCLNDKRIDKLSCTQCHSGDFGASFEQPLAGFGGGVGGLFFISFSFVLITS